ncbi:hypothetical protein [Telluribacter humicola]|uniref:hypothetical protein n=1 Tax=Telluribacter humicola TaxID=1720261 RepID=UPI001A97B397|nr:hypothetical protein [Telluribacter humicola]
MLSFKLHIQPFLSRSKNVTNSDDLMCPFQTKAIEIKEEFDKVFGETYPDYLDKNRPNEKPRFKQYRADIYKNPFLTLLDDIEDALDYIREADDYAIIWAENEEAELLKSYMEPRGASTWEEFFFENVKDAYIQDPNAVLVVLPVVQPKSEVERYQPVKEIIPSANVLRFERDKFAVLESERKNLIQSGNHSIRDGRILYFMDHESFTVAEEVSVDGRRVWKVWGLREVLVDNQQTQQVFSPLRHQCGTLPARKVGKKLKKRDAYGNELYNTLFQRVYPHIKDAQARYNDIQVEIIHHIHAQEWRVALNKCSNKECKDGDIPQRDEEGRLLPNVKVQCPDCKGTGHDLNNSGLDVLIFSMAKKMGYTPEQGSVSLPQVPGGFIPRPIESLQELVKEYERLEKKVYAGMKMLFALQTPEVQSGVAKSKDREEMYRMLVKHSSHLCGLLQWQYEMGARWMLLKEADNGIPSVVMPIRFDLSNAEETRSMLNDAKKNGYATETVLLLEKKVLEDNTSKDSDYYKRYQLRTQLDPFLSLTNEAKMYAFAFLPRIAKLGSPEYKLLVREYMFSMYFDRNVNKALVKNENFLDLPIDQVAKVLWELTDELANSIPDTLMPDMVLNAPVDIKNNKQL